MAKRILGIVAGLVVWLAFVTVAGLLMRSAWPAYAAVAEAMTFTLPMMFARLSIGVVATLVMGIVVAAITRSTTATLVSGAILLLVFIPQHISLWQKFPVWYHLTFLLSLVPLAVLGSFGISGNLHQMP